MEIVSLAEKDNCFAKSLISTGLWGRIKGVLTSSYSILSSSKPLSFDSLSLSVSISWSSLNFGNERRFTSWLSTKRLDDCSPCINSIPYGFLSFCYFFILGFYICYKCKDGISVCFNFLEILGFTVNDFIYSWSSVGGVSGVWNY